MMSRWSRFALSAATAAALVAPAFAQTNLATTFELVVGGGSTPAFFANDNNCRSGALNVASSGPAATSLVICSRTSAPAVYVVDAATGAQVRTLDLTGVSGGVFTLNAVAVAGDGVVYVGNLINTAGSGAGLKLYQWANDAAATVPTQIANDTATITHRCGDSMNVTTSGLNRTVYMIGNNAASRVVAITSTNGTAGPWTTTEVGPTRQALGVAGDTPGGSIFMKSPLNNVIEYNQAGTQLNDINEPAINGSYGGIDYRQIGAVQYIAAVSYSTGSAFNHRIIDITTRAAPVSSYVTVPGTIPGNANTNGTGAVTLRDIAGTVTLFALASNNVYGVYTTSPSVSDWELMK